MTRFPWPAWYSPPPPRYVKSRRISAHVIVRDACGMAGLSVSEFMGPCKCTANSEARQAAVFVLHRRRPDLSWPQIARMVGRKDHSTVIHANEVAKRKIAQSPEFAEMVMKLEAVR